MKKIGGIKEIEIQVKTVTENDIGEHEETWVTVETLKGFLDLSNGDSKYTTYNAKIQESTHYFICGYKELDPRIKIDSSRIYDPKKGIHYDILLIDDPMGLNYHLEFYLRFVGGQ